MIPFLTFKQHKFPNKLALLLFQTIVRGQSTTDFAAKESYAKLMLYSWVIYSTASSNNMLLLNECSEKVDFTGRQFLFSFNSQSFYATFEICAKNISGEAAKFLVLP